MEDYARPVFSEGTKQDSLYSCLERTSKELQVLDIMSKEVVSVSSADSLQHAAQVMSQNSLWCLPVVDNATFKGVITQETVLRAIANPAAASRAVVVAEQMDPSPQHVSPNVSIRDASWLMQETKVKWLPVLMGGCLVGVVTQSDVTRAMIAPLRSIEVTMIMRPEVVAIDAGASLSEAARVMVNDRISCVVVMQSGKPTGILTPTDMIDTAVAADRDSRKLLVADAMSSPIVSVPPSEHLVTANRIMDRKHLRRLVVMDGDQVCGIITQTDVLEALQAALFEEEMDAADGSDLP